MQQSDNKHTCWVSLGNRASEPLHMTPSAPANHGPLAVTAPATLGARGADVHFGCKLPTLTQQVAP